MKSGRSPYALSDSLLIRGDAIGVSLKASAVDRKLGDEVDGSSNTDFAEWRLGESVV